MKRKFYIEDLFHRKVVYSDDAWLSAKVFVNAKLCNTWNDYEKKLDSDNVLALNDNICVSERGFVQDITKYSENKTLNDVLIAPTSAVLQDMGVPYLASEIRKQNNAVGQAVAILGNSYVFNITKFRPKDSPITPPEPPMIDYPDFEGGIE